MILPNGYEMESSFWNDFSIADVFGVNAIKDTFERAFAEWKNDYVYLTELVIALNYKLWQHYSKGNDDYAKLYNDLWEKADEYACNNLKDEELSFFYNVTD